MNTLRRLLPVLILALLPVLTSAATTVTALPKTTYAAGTYNFGPVAVPLNVSQAVISIDLTSVTTLTGIYTYSFQLSQDGGSTWTPCGGAQLSMPVSGYTLPGGILKDVTGNVVSATTITVNLPNPTNSNRRVRGSVTINESFTTSVTVTLS